MIGVDEAIVVAAMLEAFAKVTETVDGSGVVDQASRNTSFAGRSLAPVVTPVAIVTEHLVSSVNSAVLAASVKVAVSVPELLVLASNVVVPQPNSIGEDREENENVGRTRAISSSTLSGALSENVNSMDDSMLWFADV